MWAPLSVLPVLVAPALAQILQFGTGELPACAQNCAQLIEAQAACQTSASVHSCFCQSAYLTVQTNLFQTADGTCVAECPNTSDRTQIQNWFKGYCANSNSNATPASSSAAPPPTSTAAAAAAASTSSYAGTPVNDNGSWWDQHSRWVAMVIVLVIAFIIIIIAGIWFKRRHDRKVNRATSTPLPVGWGPNSDPHHYPGPTEKTSASRAHEPPPANVSVMEEGRSKSHRLSKKGRK